MKRISNALHLAVLGLFLTGCASQTFTINGSTTAEPSEQSSQHFFIHGLGQEKVVDAASLCNGAENIVKVEAQQTFVNGLLATITWGIYTPRDVMVYCRA
ncbi:MAG: Bor family protein [Woeseiaceae bacterium]|jgi:hypothetical protein|nr:Bor family protein [Woeseiaceae bacterium]